MRTLLLTPFSALSSASGTEARSAAYLAALKSVSRVDVVCMNQYETISKDLLIQENGISVAHIKTPSERIISRYKSSAEITRRIEGLLGRRLEEYSCIVSRYIFGASKIQVPSNVGIIADLDDIKWRSSPPTFRIALNSVSVRALKKKAVEFKEIGKIRALSGAVVLAERDRIFSKDIPTKVLATPILVRPEFIQTNFEDIDAKSLRLLFVGTLSWEPNYVGLIWFLETCWRELVLRQPNARMTIVGKVSADQKSKLSSYKNVLCKGFVDDLSWEYRRCDLVVAPVFSGGGALVKIAEAAFYGKPIFTTRFAAEGYAGILNNGEEIIVFRNGVDFIASIDFILQNKSFYYSLVRGARFKADSFFTIEYFEREIFDLIQSIGSSK
jgi:glycosyltransferase involved in cell wall biosynthesis